SEIKVIKRFQPTQMDDEDQITFLGTEYDDMDQCVVELADSDLHSMHDDEVASIFGFETDDSNKEGAENTEPKVILTQSEEATTDNILDGMAYLNASVSRKLEEAVPRMVVDAFEERMPELLSNTLKNILPNIIEDSIQQAILKIVQRVQETV
nr:hypothetical protein [Tanacetum cinerariifolium]